MPTSSEFSIKLKRLKVDCVHQTSDVIHRQFLMMPGFFSHLVLVTRQFFSFKFVMWAGKLHCILVAWRIIVTIFKISFKTQKANKQTWRKSLFFKGQKNFFSQRSTNVQMILVLMVVNVTMRLDGTFANVLRVMKDQTAKIVSKT